MTYSLIDLEGARDLCKKGILVEAILVPAAMQDNKWILILRGAQADFELKMKNKRESRVFSTCTAGLSSAEKIGFKKCSVEFKKQPMARVA